MFNTSQNPASSSFRSPFSLPSLSTTSATSAPSFFGAAQPAPTSNLFGTSTTTQPTGGLFGASTTTQPTGSSLFAQNPQSTTGPSLFSQTMQQPPTQSQFGQTQTQNAPAQPSLQLGQSQQRSQMGQSLLGPPVWEEGRGLGVYRTIPAQVGIIAEKWDPKNVSSPLRTYLYQVAPKEEVPLYQPNLNDPRFPLDDENKWEEAVAKRPGPTSVPSLVQGFWDLGKRAQRQREFIEACNIRLHDINSSLDAQLEIHSQRVATRMAECRRKHVVASQRTLALAAKIQILRHRGYVMDNAEEELNIKLQQLARNVFDPSLDAREQEIWARMLAIRERGKRLKMEMEKAGPVASNDEGQLDEETVKSAKRALEAYDTQLRHLQKELQLVQQEYEDWEKGPTEDTDGSSSRR